MEKEHQNMVVAKRINPFLFLRRIVSFFFGPLVILTIGLIWFIFKDSPYVSSVIAYVVSISAEILIAGAMFFLSYARNEKTVIDSDGINLYLHRNLNEPQKVYLGDIISVSSQTNSSKFIKHGEQGTLSIKTKNNEYTVKSITNYDEAKTTIEKLQNQLHSNINATNETETHSY